VNPVYYIQMAHARMCGIFRMGGIDPSTIDGENADVAVLAAEDERELVKVLLDFPALVATAARSRAPHLVAGYLLDTATLAHKWYHKHHVLGEGEPLRSARLLLARSVKVVLENGLTLLGIAAPERM
jgi:arginyl-tRNA synthetase